MKKVSVPNINSVTIAGRLSKELDLKYGHSNIAIVSTSLAFDNYKKDEYGNYEKTSSFIDITAFGKTAENMQNKFGKGIPILIEGRIAVNSYTDSNGNKRSSTSIIVEKAYQLERECTDGDYNKGSNNSKNNSNSDSGKSSNKNSDNDVLF